MIQWKCRWQQQYMWFVISKFRNKETFAVTRCKSNSGTFKIKMSKKTGSMTEVMGPLL
uniref:Uncharacterized protein n=1 Tax=Anguilla anguilla TaxID=7936 RepID=A0A0E9UWI2_ANGAN